MTDRVVIVCNYREATAIASKGARAYFCSSEGGMERCEVLVRSRSGRWVCKWESLKRLSHFRRTTLPPRHPHYGDCRIADAETYATYLPQYQRITGD